MSRVLALLTLAGVAVKAASFVVSFPLCDGAAAGSESTNAFVLPIDSINDISVARLRAATGGCLPADGDFRPVFTVALGSDGTNRNVAFPSEPLWSWHAVGIDFWTGVVEDAHFRNPPDLESGVLNGAVKDGDKIVFSGTYTVIRELDPPLQLFIDNFEPADFFVYWTHQDPDMTYSVEWAASLEVWDWKKLSAQTPGVSIYGQALNISTWSINGGFFRLRLDPKQTASH